MADNSIKVYQNNSVTILAKIEALDTLTGYTPYFVVKDKFTDQEDLINVSGTTNSTTVTFELTPQNTNITPDNYKYEVSITNNIKNYTVIQDVITIQDSLFFD